MTSRSGEASEGQLSSVHPSQPGAVSSVVLPVDKLRTEGAEALLVHSHTLRHHNLSSSRCHSCPASSPHPARRQTRSVGKRPATELRMLRCLSWLREDAAGLLCVLQKPRRVRIRVHRCSAVRVNVSGLPGLQRHGRMGSERGDDDVRSGSCSSSALPRCGASLRRLASRLCPTQRANRAQAAACVEGCLEVDKDVRVGVSRAEHVRFAVEEDVEVYLHQSRLQMVGRCAVGPAQCFLQQSRRRSDLSPAMAQADRRLGAGVESAAARGKLGQLLQRSRGLPQPGGAQ